MEDVLTRPGFKVLVCGFAVLTAVVAVSASAHRAGPQAVWESRYAPGPGDDLAVDLAADGRSVFAGGASTGPSGNFDRYVGAFDASTGASRWQLAPDSPAGVDFINAVERSGPRLFAGGRLFDPVTRRDAYLAALDPRTGATLWEDQRDLAGRADEIVAIAAAGNRVVSAGYGGDCAGFAAGDCDLFVRSYDARTGSLLWEDVAGGGAADFDVISALALGPNRVYAVGESADPATGPDLIVRAYRLSDGALVWQDDFDRAAGFDAGGAVVRKGGTVVAAGVSAAQQPGPPTAANRAYRASYGKMRWMDIVPAAGDFEANLSATGQVLAFSGGSDLGFPDSDFVVRGYRLRRGGLLWDRRVDTPGSFERSLDVLGADGRVWAAGTSGQCDPIEISIDCRFTVRAYAARSGAQLFADDSGDGGEDVAFALASGGGRVFAGGLTSGAAEPPDVLLRAYRP